MSDDLISYSILQLDLQPLDREKLDRAFKAVPQLVSLDAAGVSRDGFGIVVEDLPRDDALALQASLRIEGIDTEVVPSHQLLRPAAPRPLRKAACTDESFILYDFADRETPLAWHAVGLIALGNVTSVDIYSSDSGLPSGTGTLHMTGGSQRQEQVTRKPVAHLLLTAEPAHYRIEAFKFNYAYLRPSPTSGAEANFKALMSDIISRAGGALLNTGARILKHDKQQIMAYPSRHAFEEEIIWMLWKAGA